ncbi:hypothetical protein BD779DRAFT_1673442 [Infundibulicybe gibba]|nr:hypothetical protein BD779DRAFT_1673442 [Infundibulicybe gibba]
MHIGGGPDHSPARVGGRAQGTEERPRPFRAEGEKKTINIFDVVAVDDLGEKKRSKKRRRESRERRKEKKRERKERKEKKKAIYTKAPEFHTWLVEERKINPETSQRNRTRKNSLDINEATLPHEKYYNMEAHERRMSALRQGEFLPPPEDTYDPRADMKAIVGAHKRKAIEQDSYLNKEQLMELRQVLHDRTAAAKMKLIGMEVGQNMGVRMDGTMFDE